MQLLKCISYVRCTKHTLELETPLETTSLRQPTIGVSHRERDRFPPQHHSASPPPHSHNARPTNRLTHPNTSCVLQAALEKVEKSMAEARAATSGMLEPDSDDEDGPDTSRRSSMIGAPAAVSEQDLAPLVLAAKKARAAGSTAPQVWK